MMRRKVCLIFPVLLAATLLGGPSCMAADTWEDLIPGVRHLHRVTSTPWDIHVIIVDLTNPRVKLRVGIKNDNDKPDGGETVRSECQRYNAVAGINCDYFAFTADQWHDYRHIPQGYTMTDGLMFLPPGAMSPIVSDRTTLAVPADSTYVSINKFMTPGSWWWNVVAGGPRIIRNGVVGWESEADIPDQVSRQPRTGAAISRDWRTLILATVDGRQVSSAGMTANELAALLVEFGGYQGLDYDSGGSTSMVVNGVTLNRPSDGSDRPVADCLMVMDKLRQGSNPTVSFESIFESLPYAAGDLGGADGWVGKGSIIGEGRGGSRCAYFSNASSYRNFSATPLRGVQWVEFYVKCSSTNSNASVYAGTAGLASAAAVIKFGSGGQIQAYDTDASGSPIWSVIGAYTADTWYRVHIRLDYNINSYQAFVNGALKISGAAFKDPGGVSGLQAIKFEEAGGTSGLYVDDIYAGNVDPDFVRVSPDSLIIVEGGRKQFQALSGTPPATLSVVDERDSGGSPAPAGTIALISPTGVLTAVSAGWCAVQAIDGIGRIDKSAIIAVVPKQSISEIKALANGSSVQASGLIVSAVFNGCIYAQEPNNNSGVKIVTAKIVPEGAQIWLTGTLDTVSGERVINASQLEVSP